MSGSLTIRVTDHVIGTSAALVGGSGLTLQWITDFSSLLLIGLNIALAIGGLLLLRRRNRVARLQEESLERGAAREARDDFTG